MINSVKNSSLMILLNQFSEIGKVSTNGVTRKVYDSHWVNAQLQYAKRAKQYGLKVFMDQMGNVYASNTDDLTNKKVILTGSHVDTVENGGRYDGIYGDLASLVSTGELFLKNGESQVPIVAVSFSEEEGSRFETTFSGSKFTTNQFNENDLLLTDEHGIDFETARSKAVSTLNNSIDLVDTKLDIQEYLELHVEQGPVLENRAVNIGVVSGITGQIRLLVTVIGRPNHAGTTPMDMRDDALRSSTKLMSQIYDSLSQIDSLRFTIGKINAYPNVTNVIPGKVVFSIDMRDLDQSVLSSAFQRVSDICNSQNVKIDITTNVTPSKMDPKLIDAINKSTSELNLSDLSIPSGAGHDAQVLSYKVPTGMIFVPSVNGVSHSPEEFTEANDLENGLNVLKRTLYKLAY